MFAVTGSLLVTFKLELTFRNLSKRLTAATATHLAELDLLDRIFGGNFVERWLAGSRSRALAPALGLREYLLVVPLEQVMGLVVSLLSMAWSVQLPLDLLANSLTHPNYIADLRNRRGRRSSITYVTSEGVDQPAVSIAPRQLIRQEACSIRHHLREL